MTASNADQITTPKSIDLVESPTKDTKQLLFPRRTVLPNTTIAGYARVITKYGDCNIINYSATTRYKDYSVTEYDDCIVTRFTRVSNERLD